jgi:hypothetical protein
MTLFMDSSFISSLHGLKRAGIASKDSTLCSGALGESYSIEALSVPLSDYVTSFRFGVRNLRSRWLMGICPFFRPELPIYNLQNHTHGREVV